MNGNKRIKCRFVIWKCECANCGDKRSIEVPQELTPRYCTQCGSEANYHKVDKEVAHIEIVHKADGRKALMINGIEIPCVKNVRYKEFPSEVSTVIVEIIPTTFVSDRSNVQDLSFKNEEVSLPKATESFDQLAKLGIDLSVLL